MRCRELVRRIRHLSGNTPPARLANAIFDVASLAMAQFRNSRDSDHSLNPRHGGDMHGTRTSNTLRTPAYTLVELMIVVTILAIVAVTAIPAISHSISAENSMAAAKRISCDLELARRHAIATGASVSVTFDTSAKNYVLTNVPDPDKGSASTVRDFTKMGLSIGTLTVSASSVTFDRYGNAVTPFQVDVTTGSAKTSVRAEDQEIK